MENFSLRQFIKSGLLDAIGIFPNFKIKIASIKWLVKGHLIESDLAEISQKILGKNSTEEIFSISEYAKNALLEAIGQMPSYEIKILAMDWFDKGFMSEVDLAEIQSAIDGQNIVIPEG